MDPGHNRGQAVLLAARPGHETLGHLPLHHHHKALDLGDTTQGIEDQWRPHVVWEIGNHHPATTIQFLSEVGVGYVEKAKLDGEIPGDLVQHGKKPGIDLVGDDVGARGGQSPGQGPRSGADLHDLLPGAHSGDGHDLPGDVGIGEEVLAQPPRG